MVNALAREMGAVGSQGSLRRRRPIKMPEALHQEAKVEGCDFNLLHQPKIGCTPLDRSSPSPLLEELRNGGGLGHLRCAYQNRSRCTESNCQQNRETQSCQNPLHSAFSRKITYRRSGDGLSAP